VFYASGWIISSLSVQAKKAPNKEVYTPVNGSVLYYHAIYTRLSTLFNSVETPQSAPGLVAAPEALKAS
jgi:hypothetical protein